MLAAGLDTSCPGEECSAIRDIGCATEGMAHRTTSNSMAYRTERDMLAAQRLYARNILALGKEHPRRIPLYCRLLAQVATAMTGDPTHDRRTFLNITELAILLGRPRRQCFDQVAAAMPKDERTQKELRQLTTCMGQRRCRRSVLAAYVHNP